MKYNYFFLLLGAWLSVTGPAVRAQWPKTLDSLEVYAKTHPPTDTNYIQAIISLAHELNTKKGAYQRADSLLRIAERLSIQLDYGRGLSRTYTNIGNVHRLTDRYQEALAAYQKALKTAEFYKSPPRTLAQKLSDIAAAFIKLRQYDKAVETELQSLKLQEQFNVQPRYSGSYQNVGLALKYMNKPREALTYFGQALAILNASTPANRFSLAICESNIGRCYDDLNEENNALTHYKASLNYLPEGQYALFRSDVLNNIGLALRKLKRFREAKPYLEQSLAIGVKEENKQSIGAGYFNLGRFYEETNDYKLAEQYLKKALAVAHERGDPSEITDYTQGLADLYGGMKNFQQAYVFQLEKNRQTDSTTAIRTSAEVQRMVARYETEKKEASIRLLQQQAKLTRQEGERTRFRNNALLIGAALLLLLGAALSAWLLNRAKLRRLEEAQKLRKQIAHDLHDEVGSTLSSISLLSGMVNGLIAQNRPESVSRAIDKINTDARQILEAVDEIIWTINPGNDSLQRIALRLQEYAQPLMESKGIRFTFAADSALDGLPISMEVRRNLYLIGKEAINNLVKYSQATQATVRFERRKDQLSVLIEDNGRGFDVSQPSERTGQSSMQQRAKAMGGMLKVRSAPGEGTTLELTTVCR